MQSDAEQPAATAAAPAGAAGGRGGRGGAGGAGAASDSGRVVGTDLVLFNLASGDAINVGNVAEFGFDDSGEWLAYAIDARDQIGNGVQLRNLRTDVVRAIDSDRALYRRLAWADSALALTVLRGKVDSLARDTIFSVLTFTGMSLPSPKKVVFDAAQHTDFPAGMKIASERAPRISDDLTTVFFGIREAKKASANGPIVAGAASRGNSVIQRVLRAPAARSTSRA